MEIDELALLPAPEPLDRQAREGECLMLEAAQHQTYLMQASILNVIQWTNQSNINTSFDMEQQKKNE